MKDNTGTTLRISSKMFDGNDLRHHLLLTARQKMKLRNAFNINTSADIKLSKAQINKIIQSGGFLGSLLSKLACPLMKIAVPLAKKCFNSIRNNSSCISIRCRNAKKKKKKKKNGSGTTTLIISNEEMNDIMKIVQALEDSNISLKGVTKTIKNETKEQKGGFLSMLLVTFGVSLLGNLLAGKGTARAGYGHSSQNKMDF